MPYKKVSNFLDQIVFKGIREQSHRIFRPCLLTVSYTHLDVYKRQ